MADNTLGRFVFEFIADVKGLKQGTDEASKSAENLAKKIDQLVISNDHTVSKMIQLGQIMIRASRSFEKLSSSSQENVRVNRENISSYEDLNEQLSINNQQLKEIQSSSRQQIESTTKQNFSVNKLTRSILGLAAAYFSVKTVEKGFKEAFSETTNLSQSAELLNLNTNELKAWVNIAEQIGASGSSVINTFKDINKQIGDLLLRGEGGSLLAAQNIFGRFGFRILDEDGKPLDAAQIILNFSQVFENVGLLAEDELNTLNAVAAQLGLNEDIIRIAMLGRLEIEKRLADEQNRNRQLTKDEIDSFKELTKEIAILKQSLKNLFLNIGVDHLETAINFLKTINSLIDEISKKGIFSIVKESAENVSKLPRALSDLLEAERSKQRANILEKELIQRLETQDGGSIIGEIDNSPINNYQSTSINTNAQGGNIIIGKIEVNSNAQDGKTLANDLYDGLINSFPNQIRTDYVATNELLNNARKA